LERRVRGRGAYTDTPLRYAMGENARRAAWRGTAGVLCEKK
jgi:hypothetical protein